MAVYKRNQGEEKSNSHKGGNQMITVLQTLPYKGKQHPFLTKQFSLENGNIVKKDYDKSWTYDVEQIPVNNLDELMTILLALSIQQDCCVIRGELKSGMPVHGVVRQKSKPDSPFQENPKGLPFIMIDFDKIPYPEDLPRDKEWYLEYLISFLPDYLTKSDYIYQWSSQAGLDNWKTLRCHIWFWLNEPRTDTQMDSWAKELNESYSIKGDSFKIDKSVFGTVQPNYIATPIFVGMENPISERIGMVKKEFRSVSIPVCVETKYTSSPSGKTKIKYTPQPPGLENKFDIRLQSIGPDFHNKITEAVGSWFALTGPNSDTNRLKDILRARILVAPGEGSCGLPYYISDDYLDHEIDSCIFQHKEIGPDRMPETDKERIIYKMTRGVRII
jgi:hypothetical protein